jgi:hypothetical protein
MSDNARVEHYAKWLKENKNDPNWGKVAETYKTLRAQQDAQSITAYTLKDPVEANPFGGVNLGIPKEPLEDGRFNRGGAVVLANNLPGGDEAMAGIVSTIKGKPYEPTLDTMRQEEAAYREAYPDTSLALGTVPGLVGAVTLGSALKTPATLAGRVAQGGAAGAGVGALYGFGEGEGGFESRLGSAATGSVVGGGLGLAAPVVATGAGNLWAAGREALTVDPILRRLGISKQASDIVGRAFDYDDVMGDARQNVYAGGGTGMLADAGPNTAQALDSAIVGGGRAAPIAQRAVNDRAAQAGTNLQQAFDQKMGRPLDIDEATKALREVAAPKTNAAYEAAYSKAIDYSHPDGRQIEEMLKRVPQQAVAYANELMRKEGVRSRQIIARMTPDGETVYESMPDVRQLDYITRAMNEAAYGTEGAGAMGGFTASGRIDKNNASSLRRLLKGLVPEYENALNTAAGPIRIKQAFDYGYELLKKSTTRGDVRMELDGMGTQERRAVATGIRSMLDEITANANAALVDPSIDIAQAKALLKSMNNDAVRDKIATVIGDQDARHVFTQLDNAARAFHLRGLVARGSQTAIRQLTSEAKKAATEPGVIGTLLSGDLPKAGKRMISTASGHTDDMRVVRSQAIDEQIARILTQPRGQAAITTMNQIKRANARRMLSQEQAAKAISTGRWIAPAAAYTGAQQK